MVTLHIEAWGTVMCLNMVTKACSPHCTYIHGPNVAHCSVPYRTAISRRGGVSKTWHKSVCADRLWQSVCSKLWGGSAIWLLQMLFISMYVSIIVICCNHWVCHSWQSMTCVHTHWWSSLCACMLLSAASGCGPGSMYQAGANLCYQPKLSTFHQMFAPQIQVHTSKPVSDMAAKWVLDPGLKPG